MKSRVVAVILILQTILLVGLTTAGTITPQPSDNTIIQTYCPNNLLGDPSFEDNVCTASSGVCNQSPRYTDTYNGVTYWTGFDIDVLNAPTRYPAAIGNQAIDLNGNDPGSLAQQFTFTVRRNLLLSFYAASNPGATNPTMTVDLVKNNNPTTGAGTVVYSSGQITVPQHAQAGDTYGNYTLQSFVFPVATFPPGTYTLVLNGTNPGASGVFVDSFCLTQGAIVEEETGSEYFQNSFQVDDCGFMPSSEVDVRNSGYQGVPSNDGTSFLEISYPSGNISDPVYTDFGASDCFNNFTDFSTEFAIYLDSSNHPASFRQDGQIGICSYLSGLNDADNCGPISEQIIAISYSADSDHTFNIQYSNGTTPVDTSGMGFQTFSGTGYFVLKSSYLMEANGFIAYNASLTSPSGQVVASFADTIVAGPGEAFGLYEVAFCDTCDGHQGCANAQEIYIDSVKKYAGFDAPAVCTSDLCPEGCLGSDNCELVSVTVTTATSPPASGGVVDLDFSQNLAIRINANYQSGNQSDSQYSTDYIESIHCTVTYPNNMLSFASSLAGDCYSFAANDDNGMTTAECNMWLLNSMSSNRFGVYSAKLLLQPAPNSFGSGNITVTCAADNCANLNLPSASNTIEFVLADEAAESPCDDSFSIKRDGATQFRISGDGDVFGCSSTSNPGQLEDLCSLFSAYNL